MLDTSGTRTTTAEDLVPTLLSMYDTLVGRPGVVVEKEAKRPTEPPPLPPPVTRPLSVTSIASSSSSSSSSVTSSCSGRRRLASKAYLASIESLDDSEDEAPSCRASKAGSHGSGDSGVCSPCSYISSPSPPHNKPRYCDPHLSYMDRVVMEIIETEGVYVTDLRQVIVGYIERWENSPDCGLSEKQMSDLFGNLRQIYSFNSTFFKELEHCGLDPVKVAKVFVKNNSGFSIYTDYCTNYPRTVSVLTELMRQENTVRLFRERQSSLQHTLPLGSYLLKPVQRILKYHLLLQNIVKNLAPEAEGYGDVVDALSTMTAIAHHINDMKRKHEHAVRVQEIQSLLLGWQGEDLTTYGELCAEGTFRMSGAKALRHAFLFDQILLITKKKEEGILGYKAHIMCSNLMLIESVTGEPLSFHVIPFDNPRYQYTLQARSLEQKREWTLQLKRVILENYNAVIPSHARQLVMQLGQNRTDDEIMAEKTAPKRQHSAPEYLERRKQERERRKSETGLRARLRTRNRKSDTSPCITAKTQQRLRRISQIRGDELSNSPTENQKDKCGNDNAEEECYPPESQTEQSSEGGSVDLHISEQDLEEQPSPQVEKKKTIEEIVSQLLMQNKEFQRVLKKQRHITSRRHRIETSDEEDEGCGQGSSIPTSRSTRSLSAQREGDYDNLQNVWDEVRELDCNSLKRTQSFTSQGGYDQSSPEVSLSGSTISFDGPTSPAVWLKQQRQHLAIPTSNKAGSLPRGFQLGTPDWHRARISPDRPFTIASDKAQELNLEDMQRYCDSQHDQLTRHRFPLPDDTTEEDSTPDASTQHLNVHPEYKIYRPSLTKATLKQVISSVSNKLANLRLSSEALDEIDDSRTNKLMNAFAKTFVKKKSDERRLPVYKQGSSALGARIAHGNETSDYADPRTLFPNITQSKKAAALLGIRPYSVLSLVSNLTSSSSSGYAPSNSSKEQQKEEVETVESDGSADSFYEKSFEAIESTMINDVCRDSAIFSEHEDILDHYIPKIKKKVPPPVPDKPPSLKSWKMTESKSSIFSTESLHDKKDDDYDSSSVASTVIETTATKGWVKHVIGKIQGDQTT
ncbi:pleckstrin homology domain-containing family G member 3 isoform X2 [Cimex lectularius]|uniref:Pleckstrin homology domain-containing family G member 1 n=1 Tax=Cimex lectularius TaxID=79782 RepID=A0A8I6TDV2_CIMLE|nr:pleckstrin homology domain-containing family G member 3 isoform X2 [Cimex lectularius]